MSYSVLQVLLPTLVTKIGSRAKGYMTAHFLSFISLTKRNLNGRICSTDGIISVDLTIELQLPFQLRNPQTRRLELYVGTS